MAKLKVVLLLILAVVLADFAIENHQPLPVLRFFTFDLGTLPTFLLAYGSLALGLVAGWLVHSLRLRRKKRQAAAPASTAAQEEQKTT
jgi:uncharacterized integral membrane protein